ncbi:hypothetical protein DFQ28_010351 [Apophysomyces sp. BC1034]|nr:hypothetical protein DFQ30_010023 [Apophysomyces sp. BC1015]KAG0171338.1 hypothetical protein DFQ29_008895 [Apophysomyces sp. BC1021]KAG0184850.1 hypothetical protein DFQ28_010351 [Apophysomyces sp. BC1034]
MRIAIITENFFPKVDGVTRTLGQLLEHLQRGKHKVMLLGPESGMTSYAGAELVGTVGIPFAPYPELKLNLWRPKFTAKLVEFEPDVIHLVDPVWLGATALVISRLYLPNVPVVASYHTNLATYCQHFGWGIFSPLMWRWNQYCHSKCVYTVCPSKSTSRILQDKGFQNVRIWPRGVDIGLFSPDNYSSQLRAQWMGLSEAEAAAKTVILYVGRVSLEKNIGLVVNAYKEMDHQKSHLVIVGHGPAFDSIQSECARSAIPVTFTGYLQGMHLATAFASANIFAFPSATETFGQVVLESMASGLAVAGLLAEGVRDLVEHGKSGLLLDTTDLSEEEQCYSFKQNLEQLVADPDMRRRMSREAVKASKRYTWYEAMECMTRTYRDAAGFSLTEKSCFENEAGDSGVEEDFALEDNIDDLSPVETAQNPKTSETTW